MMVRSGSGAVVVMMTVSTERSAGPQRFGAGSQGRIFVVGRAIVVDGSDVEGIVEGGSAGGGGLRRSDRRPRCGGESVVGGETLRRRGRTDRMRTRWGS